MNWSIVWVIMERRGVSSEHRRSSYQSHFEALISWAFSQNISLWHTHQDPIDDKLISEVSSYPWYNLREPKGPLSFNEAPRNIQDNFDSYAKLVQVMAWCHLRHCVRKSIPNTKSILHFTNINGLVQERYNSSALAMELCLSCTNPSICSIHYKYQWMKDKVQKFYICLIIIKFYLDHWLFITSWSIWSV